MPQSAHKGARSRLADVLADIKNSRSDDDYEYNNHDYATPTPAKRRSAVNYVALSGHTPRQSRSSNSASNNHLNHKQTTPKKRTYILKLFDRTVDLAPYTAPTTDNLGPLYPICRSWLQDQKTDSRECNHVSELNNSQSPGECPNKSVTVKLENGADPIDTPPQDDSMASSPLDEPMTVEVFSLPTPVSAADTNERFKLDKETDEINVKIPQYVRQFKPNDNLKETFDTSINSMNYHECLEANKQRWKKVRQDWSSARSIYEWRYEKSFKIINEIFKSHQRTG